MADHRQIPKALLSRALLALGGFIVVLAVLLFLPAGTIRWPDAWLFIWLFFALTMLSIGYLWIVNPEIFLARSGIREGTRSWDRVLIVLVLASFMGLFLVAGLDVGRLHGPRVPIWLMVPGYVLWCAGFALSIWVYRVNNFAEPTVRIQTERGHRVVDTGPYAFVRHPLYSGAMLMLLGVPLSLGSYWALVSSALGALVLIVRTVLEDRTLQAEQGGYRDYAAKVRHRLIPGVW
jgi:protein-S-isoprenylcysteine O-methyltransferase Ste14